MLEIVFDFEDFNDYKEMESSSVVVSLKKLELKCLPKLKNVWSILCQGNFSFPNLRSMCIYHCESLTSLHALMGDLYIKDGATNSKCNKIFKSLFDNKVLLPKLEVLKLVYLNSSIPLIWDDQLSPNSFGNLRTLTVQSCGFVKLLPIHVLKYLNNLEELKVRDCDMLESVIDFEDFNDYKEMESSSVVVPLKKLALKFLPKLKNVCISDCKSLTSLHALMGDLYIKDGATNSKCNKIFKSLFDKKVSLPKLEILELVELNYLLPLIWDDQPSPNSFGCLRTLTVESCGFVKLLSIHVLKYLNNLEELEVRDCDMLEIVFDFEDFNDYKEIESSSVVVPLKKLKLWILPNLKGIWSNHYQGIVSFPYLSNVHAFGCESLTSMFPESIAKGMLSNLEELQIEKCGIDMIVVKDHVSESVDVAFEFPKLTSLKLFSLPKLVNFYPLRHTLEWSKLQRLSIEYCDKLKIFEKEVSGASEIHEEESMLNSKYPLLSHDKELKLWGKQAEMLGSGQFPMYHFPKVKLLSLSVEKATISYKSLRKSFPHLVELRFSGDFEEAFEREDVAALAVPFSKLTLSNISTMGSLSTSLVSLPNLTHLEVTSTSYRLTALMTSSTAQCLVYLTHLSISCCHQIEEIITKQEGEDDEDKEIIFNKLELLELDGMSRLKRFCGYNYTFRFPLLDQLIITTCPNFKIFSPGLIDTPSLKSVQLSQDWGKHHEILDTNINKILYQQQFVASRELVLDECDVNMIMNDQFPADTCPEVKILFIERFVDEGVRFPYTLLERFPKLNELHVEKSSFEEIFPSHSHIVDQIPSFMELYLANLTVLKVSKCHQLVHLVTNSIVKGLVNLETLEIDKCKKMEEIVRKEPNEDVEGGIIFNGLRILKLNDLPRLKIEENRRDFNNMEDKATNTRCRNTFRSLFSHNKVLLPKLEILELSNLLNNVISLIWDDQLLHNSFSNLKTLVVKSCGFLKMVPLHVLKSLNNLEKLEVSDCDMLEMVFGFEDLNDYKEMETSSVVVPLNLTHLKVEWCNELTTLMTSSSARSLVHLTHLSISFCDQIEEIITKQDGEDDDEDKEIFFYKLKILKLDNLRRLKRFCSHNYIFRFLMLECVSVMDCPQLTMFCPEAIHAPQLQSIEVNQYRPHKDVWMSNLNDTIQHWFTIKEVISSMQSMALNGKNTTMVMDVFPSVGTLYVESFIDEGVTFPYISLERFPNLDELYVEHSSFEGIFPSRDQIIDFMEKIPPFNKLHIAYLDKLKSIWKDDSQLPPIHQDLKVLKVKSCCNLVKLAPSSTSFDNLQELSVSRCHQLIHLMTTSNVKSLVSLEWLEINDCEKMEEIVMNDTNEDVESGITFNKLYEIKLTDMPSLKMFSSQSYTFKFPTLKEIKITGCPEMKMFCPGVLEMPKLCEVKIEEHDMEWKDKGDFNKTIQMLSSEKDSINI